MRTLEEIRKDIKFAKAKLAELYDEEHEAEFEDIGYKKGDFVHIHKLGLDYYIFIKNIWQDRKDVYFEGYTLYFDNGEYLEDTFARWGLWEQTNIDLSDIQQPSKHNFIERIDKITFNNKYQEMIGILKENHTDMMNNGWKED